MRSADVVRIYCSLFLIGLFAFTTVLHATPPTNCVSQPNSNIGCEFYAVSLPNLVLDNQTTFQFGVALLNPGAANVDVTVTGGALASADTFTLSSGSSVTTTLPWVSSISTSSATAKIAGGAYHITLTGPASTLQLNAINPISSGVFGASNDASLLLPVQSAGTAYRAVVWPTWGFFGNEYPGDIAVVATVAGTMVQIAAPNTIQPGAGLNASGGTVSLDAGDVLLISSTLNATDSSYGADLSGTLITSSAPVLVWTGHAGAFVPSAGVGYADHLEETLPPISALATDYLVTRPEDDSGTDTGSKFYVKVVGTVDGTSITTDPLITGAPTIVNAGQSVGFESNADFRLQSSSPVVVGIFMEGSLQFTSENGDPSQSIALPTNQLKSSIDFIAPANLTPIFAQLVAPTGATITLDASVVSGWTAIGSSGYSTTRVELCCTDAHHASGDKPFNLSVHSYPTSTSYWYPASLGIDDDIFHDGFE